MEMPNEHILDAFLQHPVRLTDGLTEAHRNEGHPEIGVLMTITPELRSNVNQIGAGDGLHNNIEPDENLPQFVVFRGRPISKLWQYMPVLVLMSSLVFRMVMKFIGLDIQNSCLLGISFGTHFNVLQWIVIFGTYYFKGFRN